jgi:hypothetical protein
MLRIRNYNECFVNRAPVLQRHHIKPQMSKVKRQHILHKDQIYEIQDHFPVKKISLQLHGIFDWDTP